MQEKTAIPNYLTIQECAVLANVSYGTIRNWIIRDGLKNTKIGRAVRIKEEDLYGFMNSYETRGYLR